MNKTTTGPSRLNIQLRALCASAPLLILGTGIYGNGNTYGLVGNAGGNPGPGWNSGTGVYGAGSDTGVFGIGAVYGVYGRATGSSAYGIRCQSDSNVNGCGGNRAWYNSSDERLKENISTIDNALGKVMQLRGVGFNWKNDPEKTPQIGFVAQEAQPVVPEVIGKDPDGYYSMSYGSVAPLLLEAIKEQQRQIEELKAAIEALKNK